MENSTKMDDLGVPLFQETTSYCIMFFFSQWEIPIPTREFLGFVHCSVAPWLQIRWLFLHDSFDQLIGDFKLPDISRGKGLVFKLS